MKIKLLLEQQQQKKKKKRTTRKKMTQDWWKQISTSYDCCVIPIIEANWKIFPC